MNIFWKSVIAVLFTINIINAYYDHKRSVQVDCASATATLTLAIQMVVIGKINIEYLELLDNERARLCRKHEGTESNE